MSEDSVLGLGRPHAGRRREARYNPMSYHNGSVWPHDNAMIAAGFARYGFRDAVQRLLEGMLRRERVRRSAPPARAVLRLPAPAGRGADAVSGRVLAAGVGRGRGVHAAPAALGLSIDGCAREVTFLRPILRPASRSCASPPAGGYRRVDLLLERHPHDVGITVVRRDGDARVVVIK